MHRLWCHLNHNFDVTYEKVIKINKLDGNSSSNLVSMVHSNATSFIDASANLHVGNYSTLRNVIILY